MQYFLMGTIAMGYAAVTLFFLRFCKKSRDRFFALFALAFFFMAANRVVMAVLNEPQEHSLWPYLLRLFGYLIILLAIVDKNLSRR